MSRLLRFVKMQGAGNDFVVVDGVTTPFRPTAYEMDRLLDRHLGIGGDELLVVEPSQTYDFRYRIWDKVGTESPMCGNGARCLARFIVEEGLTDKTQFTLETMHGHIEATVNPDRLDWVEVEIGAVSTCPDDLPMSSSLMKPQNQHLWSGEIEGLCWQMIPVWIGNPHAVFVMPALVSDEFFHRWGPFWERHPGFPEGVNVSFLTLTDDPTHVQLRVWERGTGPTLACGTGATASVSAAVLQGWAPMNTPVKVSMPGGQLEVRYTGQSAYLRGPAIRVYEGVIDLETL